MAQQLAAADAASASVRAQLPLSDAAPTTPGIAAARLAQEPRRTRFVISLDRRTKYSVFALSNPNRVIVELGDVRMALPAHPGDKPAGLVRSFRGGLSAPGRSRVVIDVTTPVVVESSRVEKSAQGGYQLSVDIAPLQATFKPTEVAALADQPMRLAVQPPLPRPAETPNARAARAFKPIIVIDPGHGGHDSGAMKHGTVEKDVVLAFSKVLREKLEATGRYKILMTRSTDVFVPLDERRAYAERHNASLFIAVHADYASTRARGATIYSLRDGVAERLKRSAKAEVPDSVLSRDEVSTVRGERADVNTVKDILADLARRELDVTQERTSMFARTIIDKMGSSTEMRDDPDKQAAFRVLKTAHFPSVLIELAYVSNRQDAALLKSDAWRNKVAMSIKTAVDNYFSHQLARLPL
ncbi:MAG: N-acetylmuramoyl-L-alanine amidase [Hyphomicrobiaceae bacterium]|nr:N-acetylmuramoyl-L-alanine amidase [Hyphomicrobiaceae bacterium]